MSHQTVFAMLAYNAKSGIVVDLGERMDVVPVVDGYKVSSGVSRSSVGGLEMRAKLQHHLQVSIIHSSSNFKLLFLKV
jgi:actin beta/gamma 1